MANRIAVKVASGTSIKNGGTTLTAFEGTVATTIAASGYVEVTVTGGLLPVKDSKTGKGYGKGDKINVDHAGVNAADAAGGTP